MSTTLSTFLRATLDGGPSMAVATAPIAVPADVVGRGIVVRRLDGTVMRTRDELLREYARAWSFPDYFWPSWDSFNDCLGDLDGQVPPQRTTAGAAPGGFLTIVNHAEQLLAEAADGDLAAFAQQQDEHRDLYRTPNAYGADRPHPLEFGLVLATRLTHRSAVRRRWAAAGTDVVVLTPDERDGSR